VENTYGKRNVVFNGAKSNRRATKLSENSKEVKIVIEFDCNYEQIEDKSVIRDLLLKNLLNENKF
jgi:hypothetical protein